MTENARILLAVCVVVFTTIAAILDWRTKKLPNYLTVSAFAFALVFHLVTGGLSGGLAGAGRSFLFAIAGFAVGFGILFVAWLIGSGGAGDVKYMGALGAWLGANMTFQVFLFGAVFTVLGAIGVLVVQTMQRGMFKTRTRFFTRDEKPGKQDSRVRRRLMPFGVPAAFAAWSVLALWFLRAH